MNFYETLSRAMSFEDISLQDFALHLEEAISSAHSMESSLLPFLRNWRKLMKFHTLLCDLDSAQRVLGKAKRWRLPGSTRKERQFTRLLAETAPFRLAIDAAKEELHGLIRTKSREFPEGKLAFFIPAKAMRISEKRLVNDIRNILGAIQDNLHATSKPHAVYLRLGTHGTPLVPDHVNYISYHTVSDKLNGLHFKMFDRPHCFSFDRQGYSGWSSFADIQTAEVDLSLADKAITADQAAVIDQNISKYAQPREASIRSDPWIFVALQIATDNVQKLARIPMMDMLAEVVDEGQRRGVGVIVKRHPRCADPGVEEVLRRGAEMGEFKLSKASIHSLISGSCAVCTVNSSVGAEALLHAKPVYLFGRAEYQYACYRMQKPGDFAKTFRPHELPIPWDDIKKFLYVLRHSYSYNIKSSSFHQYLNEILNDIIDSKSKIAS